MAIDISDLPRPPRGSVDISDLPSPPSGVDPRDSDVVEVPPPRREDRSRTELGLGELISGGVGGALGGAFLPEILRYGGRVAQQTGLPLVSGMGGFAQAMAPLVGGTRAGRGVAGGISGTAAEAAGQAYELFSEPGLGAEATRFAVGAIPVSSATTFLTGRAGKFIRDASKEAFDISKARAAVTKQKEDAIKALGTPATAENFDRLLTGIRSGVDNEIGILNTKAAQISRQAEEYGLSLIQEGERAAAAATQRGAAAGEAVSERAKATAADIAAKYEQRLAQFKSANEAEAVKVLDDARVTAQRIRDSAAGKAKDQRDRMFQAADEVERNTQQQVQEFLRNSEAEVTRLRGLLGKTRRRAEVSRGYVREAGERIGQPVTETELGQAIRAPADASFIRFKEIRDEQIAPAREKIFNAARNLELQGQSYKSTKAYADAVSYLDKLMVDPETRTASMTVPQLENQIKNIRNALEGTVRKTKDAAGQEVIQQVPGNFQSLEYLRRFLGDRASGVPAEGFDAIGQKMAGDIRKVIQGIQDEFVAKGGQSKPWTEYLNEYQRASVPINQYKSDLGRRLVGRAEWDASQFATDPADLAKSVFRSSNSVDAYRTLSGATDQEIDKLARNFMANEIFNKGTTAKSLVAQYSDILKTPRFATLNQDLNNLARTEELSGQTAQKLLGQVRERATKGLKEALKTEEPISKILERGAEARAAEIAPRRKEVAATIAEGAKAGEKALTEAEKQAARVRAEVPREERRIAGEVRREQKDIGRAAAAERAGIEKAAKVESKEAIDAAKARAAAATDRAKAEAKIPADQAEQLKSALNALGDTPANAFNKMVFGSDPVRQLTVFAPYIRATPQGIDDFQKGVVEGLVSRSRGDVRKLIRDWETSVKPAIVDSGLMTLSKADEITNKLTGIAAITQGDIKQLTLFQTTLGNLIRNGIQVPMAGLRQFGVIGGE